MNSGEAPAASVSIFEKYPPVFQDQSEPSTISQILKSSMEPAYDSFQRLLRREVYEPLDSNTSIEDQRDKFYALAPPRINRLGRGAVIYASCGVLSEIGRSLENPESYLVAWTSFALSVCAIARAHPILLAKMSKDAADLGSQTFKRKDFFRALVSLDRYEKARNQQSMANVQYSVLE